MIAASPVLLALFAGVVGTTFGLIRAQKARDAEASRAEAERKAKLEAQAAQQARSGRPMAQGARSDEGRREVAGKQAVNEEIYLFQMHR